MTTTDEQEDNVALALAVADEDIPPDVFTDKGGRQRWETQGVLLETYAQRGNPTLGAWRRVCRFVPMTDGSKGMFTDTVSASGWLIGCM